MASCWPEFPRQGFGGAGEVCRVQTTSETQLWVLLKDGLWCGGRARRTCELQGSRSKQRDAVARAVAGAQGPDTKLSRRQGVGRAAPETGAGQRVQAG